MACALKGFYLILFFTLNFTHPNAVGVRRRRRKTIHDSLGNTFEGWRTLRSTGGQFSSFRFHFYRAPCVIIRGNENHLSKLITSGKWKEENTNKKATRKTRRRSKSIVAKNVYINTQKQSKKHDRNGSNEFMYFTKTKRNILRDDGRPAMPSGSNNLMENYLLLMHIRVCLFSADLPFFRMWHWKVSHCRRAHKHRMQEEIHNNNHHRQQSTLDTSFEFSLIPERRRRRRRNDE